MTALEKIKAFKELNPDEPTPIELLKQAFEEAMRIKKNLPPAPEQLPS